MYKPIRRRPWGRHRKLTYFIVYALGILLMGLALVQRGTFSDYQRRLEAPEKKHHIPLKTDNSFFASMCGVIHNIDMVPERARDCKRSAKIITPFLSSLLAIGLVVFWWQFRKNRKHALGRGRVRVCFIVCIFVIVQFYNFVLIDAYDEKPDGAIAYEVSTEKELPEIIKLEYNTAIKEIESRIDQEQYMYIIKFTMIGAVLAVLFRFLTTGKKDDEELGIPDDSRTNGGKKNQQTEKEAFYQKYADRIDLLKHSSIAALFFWAAVVVNCIVDTRIKFNSVMNTALGTWIRKLENTIPGIGHGKGKTFQGWEQFLSEKGYFTTAGYPFIRLNTTILTTVVFTLTVYLFMMHTKNVGKRGSPGERLRTVNTFFGVITLILVAVGSLGSQWQGWSWYIPLWFWIIAGIFIFSKKEVDLPIKVYREDEISESIIGFAFPFHYLGLPRPKWQNTRLEMSSGKRETWTYMEAEVNKQEYWDFVNDNNLGRHQKLKEEVLQWIRKLFVYTDEDGPVIVSNGDQRYYINGAIEKSVRITKIEDMYTPKHPWNLVTWISVIDADEDDTGENNDGNVKLHILSVKENEQAEEKYQVITTRMREKSLIPPTAS